MKKLMIAAAAAAMIGGAYAAADAQVYDFSASLKTTACKETKVSAALAKYFDTGSYKGLEVFAKGDKIGLRKQASRKIVGVIWGCDCPTIANPDWTVYNDKTLGGYMFWDQSIDDYFRVRKTDFSWNVLNRIDTMTKCEGSFTLRNWADGQSLHLIGAGFGTVKGQNCGTYIKSMNGSVVGFRQPNEGDDFGCVFCQVNGCVVDPICDVCYADEFNAYNPGRTIAYGTWKIKYNSSAAKKLAKKGLLSQVYTFKKAGAAKDVLAFLEKYVPGDSIAQDEDDYWLDGGAMIDEDEDVVYLGGGDAAVDQAEGNYDGVDLPAYIQTEDNTDDNADFIEGGDLS